MSSLWMAGVVFACVFGGALVAMAIRRALPDHHLSSESRDLVKIGMGLIATLAALVLGLLIATAKGTYDTQSGAVNELSAGFIMLDRVLARYGPEAKDQRDLLKDVVAASIERIWPNDGSKSGALPNDPRRSLETLYDKVSDLAPKTETQRELRGRALGIIIDLGQGRLRMFARQDNSLPVAFLVVLVVWLMALFAGYGLLAPNNGTVLFTLIVCTISVSAAVFLMMELSTPFTGVMRVSSAPMQNALTLLGQN